MDRGSAPAGGARVRWALFDEFKHLDFMRTAPRIEVPVFFLMGRHDYNMQPTLVEEYYNLLDAPKGKSLIWFEDSAHSPCLEQPAKFGEVMVTRVLGETLAAQQSAAADVAQQVPIDHSRAWH